MIFTMEPRTSVSPLWWRLPAWAVIVAISIATDHRLLHQVAGGVLLAVAAITLQFVGVPERRVRGAVVVAVTVLGLLSCLVLPKGLGEILVVVAALRAPRALVGVPLRWYAGLTAVAFGATVGLISDSWPVATVGLTIPLLIERGLEQQQLIRERDRAQALLVELQNAQEAETQAAALRERGRIAREMHDVLAHSLAGLSVQLQAIRAVAARERVGPAVLEPLDKAAQLAKDGVAEARSVVSTLRDPVGLGLADLPALVDRHPGAATLTVTGEPGTLDAAAGHAVYRAVQEALTNSARYAPGSPVSVLVAWQAQRVVVTAADEGPAPERGAVRGGQGTGLGLAGMAERITESGGTVTSGPRQPRGWLTCIEMPCSDVTRTEHQEAS